MKCYALLAASLALAAASPTGVKFVDDDGNVEFITFGTGVLTVPQHCRANTCNTLTAYAKAQTTFAQAQASENAVLRGLITSLRTDLTALSKKHGDDIVASTSADLAFATADTALNQAVAVVTKMQGPKGDTGANGAPGAPGADGKDGKDGAGGQATTAAPIQSTEAALAAAKATKGAVDVFTMSLGGKDFVFARMTETIPWTNTIHVYSNMAMEVCKTVGMKPVCENKVYCHNGYADEDDSIYIGQSGGLVGPPGPTWGVGWEAAGNRFDKTCFYAPYRNDVNKSPGYDHDDMFCRDYSAADSFWKTQTSRGVYRDYHTFMCAKAIAPAPKNPDCVITESNCAWNAASCAWDISNSVTGDHVAMPGDGMALMKLSATQRGVHSMYVAGNTITNDRSFYLSCASTSFKGGAACAREDSSMCATSNALSVCAAQVLGCKLVNAQPRKVFPTVVTAVPYINFLDCTGGKPCACACLQPRATSVRVADAELTLSLFPL